MDCGKNRYPDKKAAITAIGLRLPSGRNAPNDRKAYACPRCHGWHLTKRREQDWKRTRKQRGERRSRKHSRRDHKPVRFHVEQSDD